MPGAVRCGWWRGGAGHGVDRGSLEHETGRVALMLQPPVAALFVALRVVGRGDWSSLAQPQPHLLAAVALHSGDPCRPVKLAHGGGVLRLGCAGSRPARMGGYAASWRGGS